ncbi:MAG TPA: MAPEG family protein [Patescibacteria group bacterium]|nr:MAPEG family protein [Patescibacteria group bacterium]
MILPQITAFYAGLLGLMLVALSSRVMRMRAELDVMVGDGGERKLNVAMRTQANFVEYVPMALLLIGYNEVLQRPYFIIHFLCAMLVIARLAHAHGMAQPNAAGRGRRAGALLTFAVLVAASLLCILRMVLP